MVDNASGPSAKAVPSVERRYLEALERAMSRARPQDVEFRYRAMVGLLALHQSGTLVDLLPGDRPASVSDQEDIDQLRRTVLAIFEPLPA